MSAAPKYCLMVAAPPPTRTSRSPAASEAASRAAPIPPSTKWNVVPPLHFERRTRMVGQHEDRVMKGRILSPPRRPPVLAPRATEGAEHVPTHDGRTPSRSPLREEPVV